MQPCRQGEDDGIHVIPGEKVAIVGESARLRRQRERTLSPRLVRFGDGRHAHPRRIDRIFR